MSRKPSIILVHGAWGDGSHWSRVIPSLHAKGYTVRAVQNPLTSLADDIDRTAKLAAAMEGSTLLVGHSYGGAVISGAGHTPNVIGLVYIAAFAPDKGESLNRIFSMRDLPPAAAHLHPDPHGFLWFDPEKFRENFCQDVNETDALVMALAQKSIATRCFEDKAGKPAWITKPSWYQVSENDRTIPPETQRWFVQRMRPQKSISLAASHASMTSHPDEIVALIDDAARSLA
ncbi:alpha/beta hydrolase [Phyllobacterium sp. 628]|uniref:alpha/beta hydrolase n=1 Tax=Phyllobacterium sp. 628 TaxID=2718938 RepID=UPI001662674E|nr:alpha/beta hydrolase [Phyllobacterium sp. 628]QND51648.1 alpha/beta hydrolase [Phyllobacterium sp. 628]